MVDLNKTQVSRPPEHLQLQPDQSANAAQHFSTVPE